MRRIGIVLIMSAVALAVTPGGAFGQDQRDQRDEATVVIQGVAHVGQRLDAVLSVDGPGLRYQWRRCTEEDCDGIDEANASSYTIVEADLGYRIQVRVRVHGDWVYSEPTAVVTAAPIVVAPPLAAPLTAPPPPPPPPPPVPPVTTPPRMMSPAPTVRISGRLTRRGAMIERLSVRAPRGVTIKVRCRGEGCPRRSLARSTAVTRLRAFERHLRAGIRLEIRVTLDGFIGKHTVIGIRRGKPPWRRDRCLFPGSEAPARCPAA
jgi:hypothetical protein